MNDLQFIINSGRRKANTVLIDAMIETFEEIHEYLRKWKEESGEIQAGKRFCGLSAKTLKTIAETDFDHLCNLPFGPDRYTIYMEFLNLNAMRMEDFRRKYPNAYIRWDAQADERLLAERRSGATLGQLSQTFGRNVNAIKIRLERLGAGDAETADASSHYPASRRSSERSSSDSVFPDRASDDRKPANRSLADRKPDVFAKSELNELDADSWPDFSSEFPTSLTSEA